MGEQSDMAREGAPAADMAREGACGGAITYTNHGEITPAPGLLRFMHTVYVGMLPRCALRKRFACERVSPL